MVGVAAGLAKGGLRPVVYGLKRFVPIRVLEQIKLDVCYEQLPVVPDRRRGRGGLQLARHEPSEYRRRSPPYGPLPACRSYLAGRRPRDDGLHGAGSSRRRAGFICEWESPISAHVHAAPVAVDWERLLCLRRAAAHSRGSPLDRWSKRPNWPWRRWPGSEVFHAPCLKPLDEA